jgi:NAD(P)H-flavin reductase
LKYRGTDDPITAISLLASGQGIATAYRILNEILNDPESTVEEVNLVWINEKKKDFVLNSDIEELETRCLDRLQVIRVVDISANNPDTVINDQLKNFMTQYSAGKLVLSCASDVIRVKVGSMLQELGYPDTNVISINTVPPPIAPMKDNKMITN